MRKNFNVMIIGIIGIIIITFLGLNSFQETENGDKSIKQENVEYDTGNKEIDKKLEDIEKKAGTNSFEPVPREWITSGPFQIDRSEYLLGEKVFLRIGGLDTSEKGQISFLKQSNQTHYTVYQTIPFDGKTKIAFNYYTDIKLNYQLQLCSVDDILGEWTVVFRGTNYENLKFKIINQTLPGEEDSFEKSVC